MSTEATTEKKKEEVTESVKTIIFAHNGHVGAETNVEKGKFINDPTAQGQLGCVIHSDEVKITPEAKEIMKSNYDREGGSFAGVMLTVHADGSGSSLGLMGSGKHYLGEKITYGRDCEISVVDDFTVEEFETPEDFKEFINSKDA